jgi:hypothetical protein
MKISFSVAEIMIINSRSVSLGIFNLMYMGYFWFIMYRGRPEGADSVPPLSTN